MSFFSEKPTFSDTKEPLVMDSNGDKIDSALILNSDTILNELAEYYEWDDYDEDTVDDQALRLYLDNQNGYINDRTFDDFLESFAGEFDKLSEFAEQLADEIGDVENIPNYIRYNIDWEAVAEDFRLGGDYFYVEHRGKYKNTWYVFRSI